MLFPLRRKILLGYGIGLLLVAVVLAWAVINILTLGRASDAILRENYRSILTAWNMIAAVERQNDSVVLLLLGREKEGISRFHTDETEFLQWLGRARDNITVPGEDRVIDAIDSTYTVYLNTVSHLQTLGLENSPLTGEYYQKTVAPTLEAVLSVCQRLRDINQNAMYLASSTAREVASRAVTSTLLVGIAAILFGLAFSFVLSNFITRPLADFLEATQKIAAGDYDVRIIDTASDELGRLAGEFNAMAGKLKSFHDMNIGRLIAEKKKSDAIIRNIDDGLLFIDADYRIVNLNPAAARMLNTTPAECEGKHFLEVLKSEELFSHIKKARETRKAAVIDEDRNVFTLERDESRYYYQFSITPVSAGDKAPAGVLLLLRDVTRLKELDILKSQFVMTASHELRTPLAGALMSIDLLLEKAADRLTKQELQLLTATHEDIHRLRALVNDLLELSKIESGKIDMSFENVRVHLLAEQAVAMLKQQAEEKKLKLSFQGAENTPPVKADPTKIIWVITNLISNAFRYTDPGGFVRVAAERFGSQIHVSVRDNGTGIPYEYQSRIFDKFVQVKSDRESGGSGLGLAICKEIVRAHGGAIWVDSTPGEGSVFTFTLPVAPGSEKEAGV